LHIFLNIQKKYKKALLNFNYGNFTPSLLFKKASKSYIKIKI
tara:strand:- start:9200 stop:9325 length:126 start_codon:yes stop_codon:yes gene_type:complete